MHASARKRRALFSSAVLAKHYNLVGLSVVCPEPVLVNGLAFRKEVDHYLLSKRGRQLPMGYAKLEEKQEGVVSPYLCRELSVVVLVKLLQQIFPVPVRHLLTRTPTTWMV